LGFKTIQKGSSSVGAIILNEIGIKPVDVLDDPTFRKWSAVIVIIPITVERKGCLAHLNGFKMNGKMINMLLPSIL
jgi:hypothetical protein